MTTAGTHRSPEPTILRITFGSKRVARDFAAKLDGDVQRTGLGRWTVTVPCDPDDADPLTAVARKLGFVEATQN